METAKEFVVSSKIVKISYHSQFIKKNILWKKRKKRKKKNSNINGNAIFFSLMILKVALILTFAYQSFTNIFQNTNKGTEVKEGTGVV